MTRITHGLLATAVLFWPALGQEGPVFRTNSLRPVYSKVLQIGEIVGVQFSEEGRYLIWVTPPGDTYANLWRDEVIQVARLALEVGGVPRSAVSLDFVRNASAAFGDDDILDLVRLVRTLGSSHPFSAVLRELSGADDLAEALADGDGKRADRRLIKRVVALLNQAREADLRIPADAEFLSPAARALVDAGTTDRRRLNRMILEDYFPSVARDVADRYVMTYTSHKAEEILKGSRSEAIIMDADADLKMLAGTSAGGRYALGPSAIALCAEQARADLRRGAEPHRGEYVVFFDLVDLAYEPMEVGGVGAWMRNPTLASAVDRGTGDAPECAARFAANLTRRVPHILEQEGEIPQHLRDLKTLLLLERAIQLMATKAVAVSLERLARLAVDAQHLSNKPPKVVELPLAIAANGRAMLFSISGAVQFGGKSVPQAARSEGPAPAEITAGDTPAFIVNTVNVGGRSLWTVDVPTVLTP